MAARGQSNAITRTGVGRPAFGGGRFEFDGARESQLTERAHVGVAGEGGFHLASQQRRAVGDLARREHRLQLTQRFAGDRTAERIAGEGVAVEEGLPFGERAEKRFVDLFGSQRGGER